MGRRVAITAAIASAIGIAGGLVAQVLVHLIGLITNLVFFHRIGWELLPPVQAELGWWVIGIPVAGALVVGLMARYGSPAIRGHGIPEVMEKVLHRESRISPRVMILKPILAAIAIGTGGPFGAEGPIIATGGALGSIVGQMLHITADERKTLLAAGAAAGMAATFGSPVAAVLLAIKRRPAVIFADSTLREAADHVVREEVGRLPVVKREDPCHLMGFLSRSDVLAAHSRRLRAANELVRLFGERQAGLRAAS